MSPIAREAKSPRDKSPRAHEPREKYNFKGKMDEKSKKKVITDAYLQKNDILKKELKLCIKNGSTNFTPLPPEMSVPPPR
jgi:hypothetical protein